MNNCNCDNCNCDKIDWNDVYDLNEEKTKFELEDFETMLTRLYTDNLEDSINNEEV